MSLLLTALLAQPVDFTVREPSPASPWTQSVRAFCGRNELRIEGYGAGHPPNPTPSLRVNGRLAQGAAVRQIVADLSNRRAVYRLEIVCGDPGTFSVRISQGEANENGTVRYRFGRAFFRGNLLQMYRGLEDGPADGFWFR
jgi:hypothetical protein